jgi:hypothetical protein
MEMIMKIQNLNMRAVLVSTAIPLLLSVPLTAFAQATVKNPPVVVAPVAAGKNLPATLTPDLTTNFNDSSTGTQLAKEAVDAAAATQTALKALANNQPKQALAALQVASGDLHLLLAREPALNLVPVDIQIQVLEGPTDLIVIKSLKNQLSGLINDEKFQEARPILEGLVDEIRVTVASLPLGAYLASIDQVVPQINAGNLSAAKIELIRVLDTLVYEEEVTPLSIFRAEDKLNQAIEIAHKEDLAKPENKDKISNLVKEANHDINVAEALGYGTKKDFEPLYKQIETLKKSIGTAGFAGEWQKIKDSLTAFKNKILHPHARSPGTPAIPALEGHTGT